MSIFIGIAKENLEFLKVCVSQKKYNALEWLRKKEITYEQYQEIVKTCDVILTNLKSQQTDYDTCTIDEIQHRIHKEYKKNGYLAKWTATNKQDQQIFDVAELGLIDTEVSEAIEEIRKKDINEEERLTALGFEMADIIIRAMNFCSRKGIRVSFHVINKDIINSERGELHGKGL